MISALTGSTLIACAKVVSPADFVQRNYATLDLADDSDLSSFGLLDPYIKKTSIFLTGEYHHTSLNTAVTLQFVKCLNQKAGVRYYILEMGDSPARLLNSYLDSGDEQILDQILVQLMDPIMRAPACTHERIEEWRAVHCGDRAHVCLASHGR